MSELVGSSENLKMHSYLYRTVPYRDSTVLYGSRRGNTLILYSGTGSDVPYGTVRYHTVRSGTVP